MSDKIYGMVMNDFIEVAASKSHTPGGGNVSAVVATLGSAMIAMVGNLTVANKKYADHHEQAQAQVDRIMAGIEKLKQLTNDDIAAFDAYMAVFKMPKETDEDKKARAAAMQAAAKHATNVPLEICRTCLAMLKDAYELAPYGNKMAISDVGVGAYVCEAALKACMLSVDINLPSIKDQDFVAQAKAERAMLFAEAEDLKNKALTYVKEAMGC
jgi:formiminotetrahydrofolate cyclodeaminase